MTRPVIGAARRFEPVQYRYPRSVEEAFGPGARLDLPRETRMARLCRWYVNQGPEGPVVVAITCVALVLAVLALIGSLA